MHSAGTSPLSHELTLRMPERRAMEASMKNFGRIAVAVALVGAAALATATPGEARDGRNTAAAIGFGAGALVGAAAVSSA